jgi:nitrate reductase gamma subunit
MKQRNRRPTPLWQSRLGFHLLMWAVIALSIVGFVAYAHDAAFRAQHFPPDYVHPSDYYAEGCLAVALVAGMFILLTRMPASAPRYRRTSTARGWYTIRPDEQVRRYLPRAKQRRKLR